MLVCGEVFMSVSCCADFQMAYAPNSFALELSAWRSVIYLNLTKSILTILDLLTKEAARAQIPSSSSSLDAPQSQSSLVAMASSSSAEEEADTKLTPFPSPHVSSSELGFDDPPGSPSSPSMPPFPPEYADSMSRAGAQSVESSPTDNGKFAFTRTHAALLARLQPPLLKVQETLEAILGAPEPSPNSPYGGDPSVTAPKYQSPHEVNWRPNMRRPKEFAITTRTGWKAALIKVRERISTSSATSLHSIASVSQKAAGKRKKREDMDVEEVREVLCELGTDMQALWEDEGIRALLKKRKVRLEEKSGLYVMFIYRSTAVTHAGTLQLPRRHHSYHESEVRAHFR